MYIYFFFEIIKYEVPTHKHSRPRIWETYSGLRYYFKLTILKSKSILNNFNELKKYIY